MNLYCFDFDGAYLGYLQGDGELFDSRGRRWATLRGDGTVYDVEGNYRGHIDAQGSLFDERGNCWGYLRDWTDATDQLAAPKPNLPDAAAPAIACA